jgi:uncharacterized membrane protein YkvA (DUF1232 family)
MPKQAHDLATTLRFFLSPRAGFWPKLFFLAAIVYVIMPLDLIPDVAVVVGWIDDLAAILGATTALLLALKRYQREHQPEMAAAPVQAVPRVIETDGTEVR